MSTRSPRYTITTSALVLIALLAFGFRFAARYLPERQPNNLRFEYGAYLRWSQRQPVDWFVFDWAAFKDAAQRDKSVFVDVGSTMSLNAKRFSEDYVTDSELRRLLHDHFEAIKVDALATPWIAEALGIEAASMVETGGFFAAVLHHDGSMIEWSGLLPREGDDSMLSWLSGVARKKYSGDPDYERRARASREGRVKEAASRLAPGTATPGDIAAWSRAWDDAALQRRLDTFRKVSTLPMEVLLGSQDSRVWGTALALMAAMAASPVYDFVEGGFYAYTGPAGWPEPVNSKRTGHALQVAAAYAEAAAKLDLPLFRMVAEDTARWSLGLRVDGLFATGISTDQDYTGRSAYYASDAAEGLLVPVDEFGNPILPGRTSLAESVSARSAEFARTAGESLRKERAGRARPRRDDTTYSNLNGQAISGLFRIGVALENEEFVEAAREALSVAERKLVQPLGDVKHAPTGPSMGVGYAPDFAWIARAALDGYRATEDRAMLDLAKKIMDRMVELFRTESGGMMSYLQSLIDFAGFDIEVYDVADGRVASCNALTAANFADLAAATGETRYLRLAEDVIRAFSGGFDEERAPAGFVLAARKLQAARNALSTPSLP